MQRLVREIGNAAASAVLGAVTLFLAATVARALWPVEAHAKTPHHSAPSIQNKGPGAGSGPSNCNFNGGHNEHNDCRTQNFQHTSAVPLSPSFQRVVLHPGHEAEPKTACGSKLKSGEMLAVLGNVGSKFSQFPATLLRISGIPILTVDEVKGIVNISLLSLSDENHMRIADITSDRGWVDPNYEADLLGGHELVIYDRSEKKNVLLDLDFANPTTFIVSGSFHYGDGSKTLVAAKDAPVRLVRGDGTTIVTIDGTCLSYFGGAVYSY